MIPPSSEVSLDVCLVCYGTPEEEHPIRVGERVTEMLIKVAKGC